MEIINKEKVSINPILVLVIILVYSTNIIAQTLKQDIDNHFSYYNNNGMFNGVVLVAENGNIVHNKVFGFSDFENKIPFDSLSVFSIASITKTFTAVSIMRLKDKGLLSYDNKLSRYFSFSST